MYIRNRVRDVRQTHKNPLIIMPDSVTRVPAIRRRGRGSRAKQVPR